MEAALAVVVVAILMSYVGAALYGIWAQDTWLLYYLSPLPFVLLLIYILYSI